MMFCVREGRSGAIRTKLTDSDRNALFAILQMQGFEVLLDIMETECILAETATLNTDRATAGAEAVLARHAEARAAWQHFVRVQKRVVTEVDQLVPAAEPPDVEAERLTEILDAVQAASMTEESEL